jgi:hypothetical protein
MGLGDDWIEIGSWVIIFLILKAGFGMIFGPLD